MRGDIRDLGRVVWVAAVLAGGCNNAFPRGFSNGTGGAAGTAAGTGGSPGTGGSYVADAGTSTAVCNGVAPRTGLIANFDDLTNHTFGMSGVDPVAGQTTVQPPLLIQDFSQGNWHIHGTVPQFATSFGLTWKCPSMTIGFCALDASQYRGIQFTLSGNGGPTNTLGLRIGRAEDELAFTGGCGTCVAPGGIGSSGCQDPSRLVNLVPDQNPHQYVIDWPLFVGGQPIDGVAPDAITSIVWTFPAAVSGTDAAASYDVDITIDNISFIPSTLP